MFERREPMTGGRLVTLREVKHLMPAGSWSSRPDPALDDWIVLHVAGSCTVGNLPLDFDPALLSAFGMPPSEELGRSISIVLIEGDLVAAHLFTRDNDGGVGLIVLGDLDAQAMAVGGQEIHVTGDLRVRDVFWGDYNHGALCVEGQTTATVFVSTDGYHHEYARTRIAARYTLIDEDELVGGGEPCDVDVVRGVFVDDVLADDALDDGTTGWSQFLCRVGMIELFEAGRSVLRDPIEVKTWAERERETLDAIPPAFTETGFEDEPGLEAQAANFAELMRIIASDVVPPEVYETEGYDITFHLRDPASGGPDDADYIYAAHASGLKFFLRLRPIEPAQRSWREDIFGTITKTFSARAAGSDRPGSRLIAHFRHHRPDAEPVFSDDGSAPALRQLQALWTMLLKRAERGRYFKQQLEAAVPARKLLDLLALPMIAGKYNDFWDDGAMGFWSGNQTYGFNRPGMRDVVGTIAVGREIPIVDAEFDCEKFYFKLDDIAQPRSVRLSYMSSQEDATHDKYSGSSRHVPLLDWELYQKALRFWSKAGAAIRSENEDYLRSLRDGPG